ncbi:MAG TPA: hypothetical protein VGI81_13665 [Tepidisphaeraceae bacterium]
MNNLEQRVAELERGMRRWRLAAGMLAAGLAGAYLLAAGPAGQSQPAPGHSPIGAQPPRTSVTPTPPAPETAPTPEAPAVLRAKSVELVNGAGHVVARLDANDWGGRIQFFDANGKVVAQGGSDADGGSGFGAFDDADNPAEDAQIYVHKGQADVLAEDKHGRAQLSTGTPVGEAGDVPRGASVFEHGRAIWQTPVPRRR